jgi:hypothetical protein
LNIFLTFMLCGLLCARAAAAWCRGIIKSGKVVVVLQGRYAGRKAVVVKAYEEGTADRKFSHAIGALPCSRGGLPSCTALFRLEKESEAPNAATTAEKQAPGQEARWEAAFSARACLARAGVCCSVRCLQRPQRRAGDLRGVVGGGLGCQRPRRLTKLRPALLATAGGAHCSSVLLKLF